MRSICAGVSLREHLRGALNDVEFHGLNPAPVRRLVVGSRRRMSVREIDRAELSARLARGEDFKLVMASSDWGFRAKHIPGSVHFKNVAELFAAVAKDDDIVVYCSNADCHASLALIQKLRDHGYQKVAHYAGGSSTGRRAACRSRATGRLDRPHPEAASRTGGGVVVAVEEHGLAASIAGASRSFRLTARAVKSLDEAALEGDEADLGAEVRADLGRVDRVGDDHEVRAKATASEGERTR